jgi:SAM-dependent methyltransferase
MINKLFKNIKYPKASLSEPLSQLCTYSQFNEPDYERICKDFDIVKRFHRKQWEFVYIIRCLEYSQIIKNDSKGLVFGVGKEKLPSFLANKNCYVTATDLPSNNELHNNWTTTNQHCSNLEDLFYKNLVSEENFKKYVNFIPVDMNYIPSNLTDYDFCWSSCALEHLGSLKHGLDFIKNSLKCLRPGGIAVHTTEFNLSSDKNTFESKGCSVYRKKDIENFVEELLDEGHEISLNFDIGNLSEDEIVDIERNNKNFHLKIDIHGYTSTSFGFYIKKKI